jgi:hypothetical protein
VAKAFEMTSQGGLHATLTFIAQAALDPRSRWTYIADVIHRIADDWPASRWDELMPWNWQPLDSANSTALAA